MKIAGGFGVIVLCAVAGCRTESFRIQTPFGERTGTQIGGPLTILGIARMTTETGNRSHAEMITDELEIKVPPGTVAIVPVPEGWVVGFGRDNDPDIAAFDWPGGNDHHWGLGFVQVKITDINAVDTSTSPPTQTAQIMARLFLSDENGDDPWFGQITYHLMFLGQPLEPTKIKFDPARWEPIEFRKIDRPLPDVGTK